MVEFIFLGFWDCLDFESRVYMKMISVENLGFIRKVFIEVMWYYIKR